MNKYIEYLKVIFSYPSATSAKVLSIIMECCCVPWECQDVIECFMYYLYVFINYKITLSNSQANLDIEYKMHLYVENQH